MYAHMSPNQLDGIREMVKGINGTLTITQQKFDLGEFVVCLGINLYTTQVDGGYAELFRVQMREEDLLPAPAFGIRFGVARDRFLLWRRNAKLTDWKDADTNPWKPLEVFWERFNKQMPQRINAGWRITYDELMQAWKGRSRKNATVYLRGSNPHEMFVGRKPEATGNEAVTLNDSETRILLCVDWAQGKDKNKMKKYRDKYMHTIATSLRLSQAYQASGRLLGGDSWFAGVKNAVAHREHGLHFIGDVKGGTAFFPKKTLAAWTPTKHGHFITYVSNDYEWPIYAIGVRRGHKKVRHIVSTCLTTLPAEDQT